MLHTPLSPHPQLSVYQILSLSLQQPLYFRGKLLHNLKGYSKTLSSKTNYYPIVLPSCKHCSSVKSHHKPFQKKHSILFHNTFVISIRLQQSTCSRVYLIHQPHYQSKPLLTRACSHNTSS